MKNKKKKKRKNEIEKIVSENGRLIEDQSVEVL